VHLDKSYVAKIVLENGWSSRGIKALVEYVYNKQ